MLNRGKKNLSRFRWKHAVHEKLLLEERGGGAGGVETSKPASTSRKVEIAKENSFFGVQGREKGKGGREGKSRGVLRKGGGVI